MTNRYQQCFAELDATKQGAFIPFVTLGDPNFDTSFDIIKTLIDAGADALELGIPFSDPSADGTTIQLAGMRSLASGMTVDNCLALIAKVREYNQAIPIGLLLYTNLVFKRGVTAFYQAVKQAGADSVLLADLPMRESAPFVKAAKAAGVCPIFIAPPNASEQTLAQIANTSQGYTYVLSRAGVTGADDNTELASNDLVEKLIALGAPAPVIGFGISQPEQIKAALATGAKGAISGSAVVNIIANHLDDKVKMLSELTTFVAQMKAATK